jgi:hypothetical protein
VSTKPDGGYAFPLPLAVGPSGDLYEAQRYTSGGMTLRDYFAAQALTAIIHVQETSGSVAKMGDVMSGVRAGGHEARTAYAYADAMLAERAKP